MSKYHYTQIKRILLEPLQSISLLPIVNIESGKSRGQHFNNDLRSSLQYWTIWWRLQCKFFLSNWRTRSFFESDKIKKKYPELSFWYMAVKLQHLNLQRLRINLVRKFVVVKVKIMDLPKKSSTRRIAWRAICTFTLSSLLTLFKSVVAVHTEYCTTTMFTLHFPQQYNASHFALCTEIYCPALHWVLLNF